EADRGGRGPEAGRRHQAVLPGGHGGLHREPQAAGGRRRHRQGDGPGVGAGPGEAEDAVQGHQGGRVGHPLTQEVVSGQWSVVSGQERRGRDMDFFFFTDHWPLTTDHLFAQEFPRGPGFYFNPVKFVLVLAVYLAWVRTCWWVDQDCRENGLPTAR